MISFDSPIEDRYDIISQIGKGAFSIVHSGIHSETGEQVAIKSISKSLISKQGWINLSREVEIMLSLDHSNIVKLHEVLDSDTHVYLVMQYLDGGELFDQIVRRGHFGEKDARKIIRQVLGGISYLHSLGVAHRDLKPENLLCSLQDDRVVLGDFGLAKIFRRGDLLKTHCGTPNYAAPEIIRADKTYDKSVDLWSIGVIAYVLLCGFFPFHHPDYEILKKKIVTADYSFPDSHWSNITQEAKDFIRCLLMQDPSARLTAEQALLHPWLKEEPATTSHINLRESMGSFHASQRKLRMSDNMVIN